ncbi:MAG TPA: polymer-forming cytoskeletal protein [Terriglobales bacterium]|nr:polymer-forming cytoskeletal protein [Terriglobales bacterium]
MLGRKTPQANGNGQAHENGASSHPITLLTIVGDTAKMEGKFDIADSIQIECQVGGQLNVGGKLVIGEKGVVSADVQTVDAVIMGVYEGNMVATGNVEIAATGRVSGNIRTDSLVISKGGFFNGNVVKINAEGAGNGKPVYLVDEKVTQNTGGRNRGERGNGDRGNGGDRGGRYAVEEER